MKTKRILAVILSVVMVLTLCVGCGKTEEKKNEGAQLFNDVKLEKGIVATVNDKEITVDEFRFYLAQYSESVYYQNGMTAATKQEKEDFWKQDINGMNLKDSFYNNSIDSYVSLISIEIDAKSKGIDVTDEEVNTFLSQEGLDEAINYYKTTYAVSDEAIRNYQKNQLIYEKYATQYIETDERMKISDEDIKAVFEKDYIKAQHILKSTINNETREPLSAEEVANAKLETEVILQKVKQPGADFQAIMLEESEDPGSKQQPDGYVFKEGDMVTEFYETAKALEVGEISDLVETSYGYHIIKRLPIDMEKDISTSRDSIENQIKTEVFREILNEKKAGVDIKVDYKQLYAIEGVLY